MSERFGITVSVLYTSADALGYDDQTRLQLLSQAGFRNLDYHLAVEYNERSRRHVPFLDSEWRAWSLTMRGMAESYGCRIHQTHAPTPPLFVNEAVEAAMGELLDRAIEASALMGAQTIVVHPDSVPGLEYDFPACLERNQVFFQKRAETAEKHGIHLAIENMLSNNLFDGSITKRTCTSLEELMALVDSVNHPMVGFCLDVGHANYMGWNIPEAIRRMSDRLIALHLHDNDRFNDEHLAPFVGTVDWNGCLNALKEIKYPGILTLETLNYCKRMPKALHPGALKNLAETCRWMTEVIEE